MTQTFDCAGAPSDWGFRGAALLGKLTVLAGIEPAALDWSDVDGVERVVLDWCADAAAGRTEVARVPVFDAPPLRLGEARWMQQAKLVRDGWAPPERAKALSDAAVTLHREVERLRAELAEALGRKVEDAFSPPPPTTPPAQGDRL